MTPKISVIVPVYKAEAYLHRCVDSILAQTFQDFEVLLIDDGSPDRSGEICNGYAEKDSRIKVIHKENGGVSSARNIGIEISKGKWIAFIDSDDFVNRHYLQDLYKNIKTENSIIISNYNNRHVIKEDTTYNGEKMVKYVIENNILALSAPYSKLFNRDIIQRHNIYFPLDINMGEDGIFLVRYLNSVTSITTISKNTYNQRIVEDSLSSNYYKFESEWNCYKTWKEEIHKFITKYSSLFKDPLKLVWENRIGATFNRCLQCVYRVKQKESLRKQVYYLKLIPQKDLEEFEKYYHPQLLRKKVQKFLICKKMFYTYCLIGNLSRK